MNKFLFLLSLLFFWGLSAQKQIHIQYLNVRSPIANVYEDLYTNGTKVISKQDGNIMWTDPSFNKNKKTQDFYFISNIDDTTNDRNFFFTSFVKDNAEDYYFVYDKVPQINWKIEKESTKKILGYECIKAIANFRGSSVTAYFTKEIPYSVGPFKFFGLPGAILDVRVDGKDFDLWKAVKVDLNDKSKVEYNPDFPNFTKAKMKDYIIRKDDAATSFLNSSKISGSTGKIATVRLGVEQHFEWEDQTTK
ncbi:GLPGLI family protein [Chryseobacterium sp. PMSZPI]|uniref:GLPGLI family protein n=1 Tax=Chryseobacterium sp. PMSZPI TaxID=1033900 RepID=UPI000C3375AD|nr:GLPGLI family protein [Chryseobacterium sp. PMSZPI]PKF73908.1 GLPGLI family protein [Chryseobacterium sp. PMSZPI]